MPYTRNHASDLQKRGLSIEVHTGVFTAAPPALNGTFRLVGEAELMELPLIPREAAAAAAPPILVFVIWGHQEHARQNMEKKKCHTAGSLGNTRDAFRHLWNSQSSSGCVIVRIFSSLQRQDSCSTHPMGDPTCWPLFENSSSRSLPCPLSCRVETHQTHRQKDRHTSTKKHAHAHSGKKPPHTDTRRRGETTSMDGDIHGWPMQVDNNTNNRLFVCHCKIVGASTEGCVRGHTGEG